MVTIIATCTKHYTIVKASGTTIFTSFNVMKSISNRISFDVNPTHAALVTLAKYSHVLGSSSKFGSCHDIIILKKKKKYNLWIVPQ